ncbi:hypothetical protein SKAU_G00234770 [Synaphobranchus kaupii]|uniref:Reverse transcriptase domain-containing protein n=1 Tax=Synaphobranchus kaupii TaxID=118154 RepID=A0A9Q1ITQ7_SYNKA|nr:hypothetical protein SKAU_G00234770 [Synaphobranchus kaupii]
MLLMGQRDASLPQVTYAPDLLTKRHWRHSQGSVISPVLFTLYTDNCRSSDPEITNIKYSDDTVIIDTSNTEGKLQAEMDIFSDWCRKNGLDRNASKTKELVIDFCRGQLTIPTLKVDSQAIERVEEYKTQRATSSFVPTSIRLINACS